MNIAIPLVIILILLGAGSILDIFAVKWKTEPYNYPYYVNDDGGWMSFLQVMGLLIVFSLPLVIMLFLSQVSGPLFTDMFNLNDLTTKKKRKICTKYGGVAFGFLLGSAVVVLPFAM